ncbi:MAG: hypothetical protein COW27_05095 [Nitrosopumilales archaeon CG15_BIG_FIL_POST_REV_8_21_14_020_37_12]|nr:MAG: hypothetical protein COW27_05095 [Nitrosopumilales archaeon CG15_BIG_FIL_POST_REV_8_21_14_020_37_12]
MKFSEEQIKDIIALRDNLINQIDKHHESIEMLEKNLTILDLVLKGSSFTKASDLTKGAPSKETQSQVVKTIEKSIPIKRGANGEVIANAFVTPDQVSIVIDESMEIDADTPPFKSFFIDRIIGEMKRKDSADAENGKIQRESMIDYIINKNGSDIREIIIKNYRQKERVNEIINTAGWSLTRMLDNIKK